MEEDETTSIDSHKRKLVPKNTSLFTTAFIEGLKDEDKAISGDILKFVSKNININHCGLTDEDKKKIILNLVTVYIIHKPIRAKIINVLNDMILTENRDKTQKAVLPILNDLFVDLFTDNDGVKETTPNALKYLVFFLKIFPQILEEEREFENMLFGSFEFAMKNKYGLDLMQKYYKHV